MEFEFGGLILGEWKCARGFISTWSVVNSLKIILFEACTSIRLQNMSLIKIFCHYFAPFQVT